MGNKIIYNFKLKILAKKIHVKKLMKSAIFFLEEDKEYMRKNDNFLEKIKS